PDVLSVGQTGLEEIMTRSARIGLAAALLLSGASFAIAQDGPATGGYPPGTKNPNLYRYYGYNGYHARRRYALGTPYYVLLSRPTLWPLQTLARMAVASPRKSH